VSQGILIGTSFEASAPEDGFRGERAAVERDAAGVGDGDDFQITR
jgi:hypothetical protein